MLWAVLEKDGVDPPSATADKTADGIIQLFKWYPAQARNVYSGVLLLPGVGGGLAVPPPFATIQKVIEYEHRALRSFWHPQPLLMNLAQTTLEALGRDLPKIHLQCWLQAAVLVGHRCLFWLQVWHRDFLTQCILLLHSTLCRVETA